jgi:hypothetical protein
LTTQVVKNRIYVQPFAREGWIQFLEDTPRNPLAALPIHDIPDGSLLTDPSDVLNTRLWNDDDGVNVLGTPLGSPDFIETYLLGKGIKHRQLLSFIQEVAEAGFPREAVAMLTGAAGPRLTHLLKLMERNSSTEAWMKGMELAHLSTKLHCLTSSPDLDFALGPEAHHQLTK